MKLIALLNGKTISVEIEKSNGTYQLTWEGKSFNVDAIRANHNTFSLLVGGKSYEVSLENQGADYSVYFYNDTVRLELFEARKYRASSITKKSARGGKHELAAPMPGKIIRVAVSENQQVQEGDPLLIMEAMKMQNEMKAPAAGVIRKILVKEGEAVSSQQVMIVLE